MERLSPYVWEVIFTVRTDHMPLVWLHRLKDTFPDNALADCLSRNVNAIDIDESQEGESTAVDS